MRMKTVFIVEDDPHLTEAMQTVLAEYDCKSVCCTRTSTFWKRLEKNKPDAIVLDVFLEDGRGDIIAQKLKTMERYSSIPVILMSATQELRERAMEAKVEAYLAKPFSLDKFTQVLQMYLS